MRSVPQLCYFCCRYTVGVSCSYKEDRDTAMNMMTWRSDEDNPSLHTVTFLAYGNNKENISMWDTAEAAAETME